MAAGNIVKVLLSVSALFTLVGVILVIVAFATGRKAREMEWDAAATTKAMLNVATHEHCGWSIFMADNVDCQTAVASFNVTTPSGQPTWQAVVSECGNGTKTQTGSGDYLRLVAHVVVTNDNGDVVEGDYELTSQRVLFWALDWCGELGEYLDGAFSAFWLVASAIGLFVLAGVLCCMSCCCSSMPDKTPVQQNNGSHNGGMVIGSVADGNMVVGQPVQQGQSQPGDKTAQPPAQQACCP